MSYDIEPCRICGRPAAMGLCEGNCAAEWLQKHDEPRIQRKCTYCHQVTTWNRTYRAFVHDHCVIEEKNRAFVHDHCVIDENNRVSNMKHPNGPPLNRRDRRERERKEAKRRRR